MRFSSSFCFVVMITLIMTFFNLGGIPLLDPDEPVYAETPREMLECNDFISPRIFGEFWYDKPPMYYWLVAGAFKIFGVNEFAARFPSAVLSIACTLVVYFFGRKFFSERAGLTASFILATSLEYFYLTKAAVTDITLTLCFTVALLSFLDKKYYLFYLFSSLAVVTKGPIGILFPCSILFIYFLVSRNFSELKKMHIPTGLCLFSVVAFPWYFIMYHLHGNAFIDTFIGFHNITRFTSPEHPEGVLWYYYFPVVIAGFFPWSALLFQSLRASFLESGRNHSILLFLNVWSLFIFLFFTISRTKLVSYILPMLPPLAMVVAWYIDHAIQQYRPQRQYMWIIFLASMTAVLTAAMYYGCKYMPELSYGVIISSVILLSTTVVSGFFIWQKQIMHAFWTQTICAILFALTISGILFPAVALRFTSYDISKAFLSAYDGKSPVYVMKFLRPGFAFYTKIYGKSVESDEQLTNFLAQTESAYFVIRLPEYERLTDKQRKNLSLLAQKDEKLLLYKMNGGGLE